MCNRVVWQYGCTGLDSAFKHSRTTVVQPWPGELQSSVHKRCMSVVQDMVSARTRDGRTILHSACASSNVDVVKRLLAAGAAVNVQSDDGATPLARVTPCTKHTASS